MSTVTPQTLVEHALATSASDALRRDRAGHHEREPPMGEQHADHQRCDPRRRRHRDRVPGRGQRLGQRHRRVPGAGDRPRRAGRCRGQVRACGRGPRRLRRRRGGAPTGTTRRSTPRSRSTATSPRRSGEEFEHAEGEGRVLYGFVNHEMTTTYLGSSTGLRRRHVQPTGHYGCTGKTADLTNSAWVGGATRDFSDVDAHRIATDVATRLSWGARRVDLPAGRYDTVLPPTARRRPDDRRLLERRSPGRP